MTVSNLQSYLRSTRSLRRSYTARPGETIEAIAKRYGLTLEEMYDLNMEPGGVPHRPAAAAAGLRSRFGHPARFRHPGRGVERPAGGYFRQWRNSAGNRHQ